MDKNIYVKVGTRFIIWRTGQNARCVNKYLNLSTRAFYKFHSTLLTGPQSFAQDGILELGEASARAVERDPRGEQEDDVGREDSGHVQALLVQQRLEEEKISIANRSN